MTGAAASDVEKASLELQEAVTDKLRAILGEEGVEILTEYVWHMLISPKRSRVHFVQELQEFLAEETEGFVDWVLSEVVPNVDSKVLKVTEPAGPRASLCEEQKSRNELLTAGKETPPESVFNRNHLREEEHPGRSDRLRGKENRERILGFAMQQATANAKQFPAKVASLSVRGLEGGTESSMMAQKAKLEGFVEGPLDKERKITISRQVRVSRSEFLPSCKRTKGMAKKLGNKGGATCEAESPSYGMKVRRGLYDSNNNRKDDRRIRRQDPGHKIRSGHSDCFSNAEEVGTGIESQHELQSNQVARLERKEALHPAPGSSLTGAAELSNEVQLAELYSKTACDLRKLQELAVAAGYTLAPQIGALARSPVVRRIKRRCAKWPDCAFGEECRFIHPAEMCSNWPYCVFGAGCFYIHPEVPCKFGLNCHNSNCNYKHPTGWDSSQGACANAFSFFPMYQNKTLLVSAVNKRPTNLQQYAEALTSSSNDVVSFACQPKLADKAAYPSSAGGRRSSFTAASKHGTVRSKSSGDQLGSGSGSAVLKKPSSSDLQQEDLKDSPFSKSPFHYLGKPCNGEADVEMAL